MTNEDSAQARCFCICAAGCLASPSRQRTKKANAKKNKKTKESGVLAKAPVCVIFFQSFQPPLGCTIDTKHHINANVTSWFQACPRLCYNRAASSQIHYYLNMACNSSYNRAATTQIHYFCNVVFLHVFCFCTMILSARVSCCLHIALLQSRRARRHDFAEWWLLLIITQERSQSTPITPFSLARNSLATAPCTDCRKN